MLQETKLYREGTIVIPNFIIFEKLRNHGCGGGLMTAAHTNLNPVVVDDETESQDFLIVDIKIKNVQIRTVNCYGPQENIRRKKIDILDTNDDENDLTKVSSTDVNSAFFLNLQTQVQYAKDSGKFLCIQMDANSKFGKAIIKDDPNDNMTIIEEDLVLVNATDVCNGTITRQRKTLKKTETSVLDYFIVCRKLFEMIKEMIIDEDRKFVLTKYTSKKGEQKTVKTDHNPMWCRFDIPWVTFRFKILKVNRRSKNTTPKIQD